MTAIVLGVTAKGIGKTAITAQIREQAAGRQMAAAQRERDAVADKWIHEPRGISGVGNEARDGARGRESHREGGERRKRECPLTAAVVENRVAREDVCESRRHARTEKSASIDQQSTVGAVHREHAAVASVKEIKIYTALRQRSVKMRFQAQPAGPPDVRYCEVQVRPASGGVDHDAREKVSGGCLDAKRILFLDG